VQYFSRKCANVHHIHRLLYEQDEIVFEDKCLLTEESKENGSKET